MEKKIPFSSSNFPFRPGLFGSGSVAGAGAGPFGSRPGLFAPDFKK